MSAFTPGMRLGDRYQLQERIGAGGMAEVWRAHDSVLGRAVAVKALDGRLAADASLRENARQEARAAARLSHPNITAIHDFAEQPLPDGRVVPYLVLELLAGETLARRLGRGALPWPEARQIVTEIGTALAAAHAQGVVHQDIKPSNIMLTPTGAKVLDFGIAAIRGRDSTPGWTSGTPAYAAPERLHGVTPHPSADAYSLGVVAYEMVTGELPWPISTWEDVNDVHASRTDSPTPQGIPDAAAQAVSAALSAVPSGRPSAPAMVQAVSGAPLPAASFPPLAASDLHPTAPIAVDARTADDTRAGADTRAADPQAADGTRDGMDTRVGVGAARPGTPSPTLIYRPDAPIAAVAKVPDPPTRLTPIPAKQLKRRRRSPGIAATLAVIVLLLTLGAVFLGAAWLQGSNGTNANAQPPAATSAPASPSAKPSTVDTVPALLTTLRETVEVAIATGGIEQKRAREMRSAVQDLINRWKPGKAKDFASRAEQLRGDIQERADDGDIADPVAKALDLLLKQLIERAKAN
jgi:serine/threonine-protein kinase